MVVLKLKGPRPGGLTHSAVLRCVLSLAGVFILVACGGGTSGGPSPSPPVTPPTPDFSLTVSPTSVSIQDGQSEAVSLSATGSNGFSSQVTIQVAGLPSGVTVSPSSISLAPGTPLQITISAAASTATNTATVTFTGTSGTLSHVVQFAVTNTFVVESNTPPFRIRYVRTDAATP